MELDKNKNIHLRPVSSLRRNKWHKTISYELANRMVLEGVAVIANKTTIYKLFDEKTLRRFVRKMDNNTCVYCGSECDVTDYVIPPSQGGIQSPKNMVCVCYSCKRK